MALPSATNIYSGAQPFPTLTPGAGLWLISHQLAVNTGASTLTFTVTVGGRTVYGNGIGYYKAAGITSVDFPIQVLAAAAEDIIVSVLSTNSSDTAVTSNTPSAVLQSVNTTQVDGTAVGLATEFDANVVQISGDSTAADNLEAAFDGTGAVLTLTQLRINGSSANGAVDIDNDSGPGIHVAGTNDAVTFIASAGAGLGLYSANNEGLYCQGPLYGAWFNATAGAGLYASGTTAGLDAYATVGPGAYFHSQHFSVNYAGLKIGGSKIGAPDVEFARDTGIKSDLQTVKTVDADTAISARVDASAAGVRVLLALPAVAPDGAGGLPISDAGGLDMDAILADTNELQTDWANGGRLDLLLDAITVQGSGSAATTILCQVGGVPIDGVEVWITTDIGGANVVAGTVSTDALGEADFMLDPGDYYVWRQKSGYNFTNPQTQTVA